MTTARQRMLNLSSLAAGNTARAHFLSVEQGSGTVYVGPHLAAEAELALAANTGVALSAETSNAASLTAFIDTVRSATIEVVLSAYTE